MKKNICFLILSLAIASFGFSQSAGQHEIKWYTLEDALKLTNVTPKKIYLDVYTDWCGWCKRMDATTFKDPCVVELMNKYYYPVRFNAEIKDTLHYKDTSFTFNKSIRANDLASYFLGGKMSYPTSVYLTETGDLIQPIAGYQEADMLQMILSYIGKDMQKTISWEDYKKTYKSACN